MINNKVFLFVTILVLSITESGAQEYYDLNRCITTGLEKNFSILIARNEQQIARNNFTPGNAGFLPSVSASGRYGDDWSNNRQEFFSGSDTTMNGVRTTTGNSSVNLDWTIFRGFNAITSYRRLNELKQLGELSTQLSVENFIAEISSEYYFYMQQIQLYKNLAYAVSLSRERVRIDEERYLLGASSKLQLLQSQVYLNTDSSRYSKQKDVLKSAQIRLHTLMATENPDAPVLLKDSIIIINPELVLDSLMQSTEMNNTSLLIARKNTTVSEYDLKLIRSQVYPFFNFNSAYNYNYSKFETGNLQSRQSNGFNYGFSAGINIFDGFNQQRQTKNAKIGIENREFRYQQIEQQVKADLLTIYSSYQNNILLLNLEEQNLKTAEENLEIAMERYKLGSLSGLDLREVQQSLLEAEERLLLAQYQTKLAEISLMQISGRVTEYIQ